MHRSRQTNERDDHTEDGTGVQERRSTEQQVWSQMNREGTVENGTRRRRAFHRPRQPTAERYLRSFAERCPNQEQPDDQRVECPPRNLDTPERVRTFVVSRGAHAVVEPHRSAQEADIAQAIHDERAKPTTDRRGALVEERDQEDRCESDELPSEEQKVQAPSEHGQLQRAPKQTEKQIVPPETWFPVQVATRKLGRDCEEPA